MLSIFIFKEKVENNTFSKSHYLLWTCVRIMVCGLSILNRYFVNMTHGSLLLCCDWKCIIKKYSALNYTILMNFNLMIIVLHYLTTTNQILYFSQGDIRSSTVIPSQLWEIQPKYEIQSYSLGACLTNIHFQLLIIIFFVIAQYVYGTFKRCKNNVVTTN